MNELLRFTASGQNGVLVFLPPKFDFVFYEQKMEMYKKGKLVRTINYEEIKEIVVMKNWQNNVLINCKPIGVNIYKVSDEICNKIKEITSKKEEDNEYLYLQNAPGDRFEKNGFIKIEKNKKIIIKIYDNGSVIKSYTYNFQTNVINSIPETNVIFAIAFEQDNDEYINFFINRHTTDNDNCTSPTRTFFPGLTNTYSFCRYVFEYKQRPILRINLDENKIDLDKNSYLEISVI